MERRTTTRGRLFLIVASTMLVAGVGVLPSCGGRKGTQIDTTPTNFANRPTDPIMRGTVGSIATTTGAEPILISGYGLVVGLEGTGGGVLPEPIAATLERDMQLRGVGPGSGLTQGPMVDPVTGRPKTASEILADPNVAVVLVQSVITRGSPERFEFDVVVRALNATSLRGGTLWTTDLRLGPPGTFGAMQTRRVAQAYGPVYTNPFLSPDSDAGANQPVGRVMAGGQITDPLAVQIALDTPSHLRATQITSAINSRFRSGRFDPGPIARGRSDSLVDVLIPHRLRNRPFEFLELLEFVQLDYQYPGENAQRIVQQMRRDPTLANSGMMMLIALGDPALPMARELYDEQDPTVRLAGLSAGARLRDERAEDGLMEFARHSGGIERLESINMLGEINGGPRSQTLLQELASSGPATVRVAAYYAIAARAERQAVSARPGDPVAEEMAKLRLTSRGIGGFDRTTVGGDSFDPQSSQPRFVLDRVPWGEPLIYVTQQGRPRIVLMGSEFEIRRPVFVSIWDGRFMLVADSANEPLRLAFRRGNAAAPRIYNDVPTQVDRLLEMLARVPTQGDPRPGLGLNYGEIVAILSAMSEQPGTRWAFTTEGDTLTAALAEARTGPASRPRPETADEVRPEEASDPTQRTPTPTQEPFRPQVVPLNDPQPQPQRRR